MTSTAHTMNRVIYNRHGGPEVLEIERTNIPVVKKNQVLVKNAATSINGGDLNIRKGFKSKLVNRLSRFPRTSGQDVVGRVVEVGPGVSDFQVGDLVWGNTTTSSNALAEYVAIDAQKLSLAPASLSPIEAASIPCAGDTALVALVYKAKLQAGERILIRGVGGVGLFATQIAASIGAHVTVLGSGPSINDIRAYGADEAYDYHTTPLSDLGTFDVIFDSVGTDHGVLRGHLTESGRLLTIAFKPAELVKLALSTRFGKHRSRLVIAFPNRENLTHLARLVDRGAIKPVIDSIYPMERIADAHRHADQRGVFGKITINIAAA